MANPQNPRANAEVVHPSRPFASEIPKLRKIIASDGLTGLASDIKWNELVESIREIPQTDWSPSFRFQCIDSDFISNWDCEWYHHLPFPFISVLWFELSFIEEINQGHLIEPRKIDHSSKIARLIAAIGFDFEVGADVIRIFGYAPRARAGFTPKRPAESQR